MSKIFKNINKKILSMALILTFGMGINNVYACNPLEDENCPTDAVLTGKHKDVSYIGNGSGYENDIRDSAIPNLYGLRISIVNSYGETVGGASRNFYTYDMKKFLIKEKEAGAIINTYSVTLPRTALKSNGDLELEWSASNPENTAEIADLEKKFKFFGISFSNNVSSLNLDAETMFSNLYRKNYTGSAKYQNALLKTIINLTGLSKKAVINNYYDRKNDVFNLFIVYEPLAIIEYHKEDKTKAYYVGTTYELSQFLYDNPSSGLGGVSSDENENPYRAFGELGSFAGIKLGCSVYALLYISEET